MPSMGNPALIPTEVTPGIAAILSMISFWIRVTWTGSAMSKSGM